jgi:hypothetical protein
MTSDLAYLLFVILLVLLAIAAFIWSRTDPGE